MSDGSEKRPLTKMLWSVSIKTRTFASVNTCNGYFLSCLKLLKHYRTIEQMCSDAHSITLRLLFFFCLKKSTHESTFSKFQDLSPNMKKKINSEKKTFVNNKTCSNALQYMHVCITNQYISVIYQNTYVS